VVGDKRNRNIGPNGGRQGDAARALNAEQRRRSNNPGADRRHQQLLVADERQVIRTDSLCRKRQPAQPAFCLGFVNHSLQHGSGMEWLTRGSDLPFENADRPKQVKGTGRFGPYQVNRHSLRQG
jgi:hypothetical protein